MNLSTYLQQPGMSATGLARVLGVSHSTVLRWADDSIPVDPKRAAEIIEATGGAVTATELMPAAAKLFTAERGAA